MPHFMNNISIPIRFNYNVDECMDKMQKAAISIPIRFNYNITVYILEYLLHRISIPIRFNYNTPITGNC